MTHARDVIVPAMQNLSGFDTPDYTCEGCGEPIEPPNDSHTVLDCLRVLNEKIIHLSASKADADIR
jgi:hypothetical protein